MSEEEILQELNDHLPYDYCKSEGTEDNTYQEWIDEDSWQFQLKLLVENKNKEIERLNKENIELRNIKFKIFEYIRDNAIFDLNHIGVNNKLHNILVGKSDKE